MLFLLPFLMMAVIAEEEAKHEKSGTNVASTPYLEETVEVHHRTKRQFSPLYKGGCVWRGSAPFCGTPICEFDEMDHRTTAQLKGGERGHGASCWTGQKVYCCKYDFKDTWNGKWQSAFTGRIFGCEKRAIKRWAIDPLVIYRDCGTVECNSADDINVRDKVELQGLHCTELEMFGLSGIRQGGRIAWTNGTQLMDYWYQM